MPVIPMLRRNCFNPKCSFTSDPATGRVFRYSFIYSYAAWCRTQSCWTTIFKEYHSASQRTGTVNTDVITHQGRGGTLKLGVVPTFATRWLLPKLQSFNRLYPEITVHLETSTRPFLFQEQIFDAAIYAGTPQQVEQWPGTHSHFLMHEDVVAVCAPDLIQQYFPDAQKINDYSYDLSAEQLVQLPLLQQTTRPNIWEDWFSCIRSSIRILFRGNDMNFSMLAVVASHGVRNGLDPTNAD